MGKGLFTFSSGVILGFAAGVLIDSEKRRKLMDAVNSQAKSLSKYESSFNEGIQKLKDLISSKEGDKKKKAK